MKKKLNALKCLLIIFISAFLFSGCSLLDSFLKTKDVIIYDFSGYVFADGSPLSDATVSCGISKTTTDEKGHYSFKNLSKVVEVSVRKEGYFFSDDLVYVKSNRSDVNFDGFKFYKANGIVKNGSILLSEVDVTAESISGTYSTKTNEKGEFEFFNLAGKSTIKVNSKENEYFKQEVDLENNSIIINSKSNIDGNISCDAEADKSDFSLKLNGEEIEILDDLSFKLSNVTPSSILTLESQTYHIENNSLVIENDADLITFNCQKYYDAEVEIKSGKQYLEDASLKLDDKEVNVNKTENKYIFKNLYGNHTFSATLDGFNFKPVASSPLNKNICLIGTFDLTLKTKTDDNAYEDINIEVVPYNLLNDTKDVSISGESTIIKDVELNSTIVINSENYFVEQNNLEILSNNITINLKKFYNLNIQFDIEADNFSLLNEVEVFINEQKIENLSLSNGACEILNLHSQNKLKILLNGYKFDEFDISPLNCNIIATAKKLFNLVGVVKSGELEIEGASIKVEGLENEFKTVSNEHGEFVLQGLYDNGTLVITKENYNLNKTSFITNDSNKQINLTYDIEGQIINATNYLTKTLGDVKVKGLNKEATTDKNGYFKLQDLQGECKIEFVKPYYSFKNASDGEEFLVTKQTNFTINFSYFVEGEVKNSDNVVSNAKVYLANIYTQEEIFTTTNSLGYFKFENLTDEYFMTFDPKANIKLKPSFHEVTEGAKLDFSNNGFGINGKITCGGLPVSDVVITAGNLKAISKADGSYSFKLITTQNATLVLNKQGYVFNNNNLVVSEENENESVDFTCSYSINGKILSGLTPLSDAEIIVKDSNYNGLENSIKKAVSGENGFYNISNIVGNANIEVKLNGFKFEGKTNVSEPEEINFNATFNQTYKILNKDIPVENVEFIVGDKTYSSSSQGIINALDLVIGEEYSLLKTGYNFNVGVTNYSKDTIVINCSYNVTGFIFSGNNPLANVKIKYLNNEAYSLQNGSFALQNLEGKVNLSFELDNFEFDSIEVDSPISQNIYAKYKVSGKIYLNSRPFSNVSVYAGANLTTSNNEGYFEFVGLTNVETISFEKEGYKFVIEYNGLTFNDSIEVMGPINLNVCATYSVSGVVKSGDLVVSQVEVEASNLDDSVFTDSQGRFTLLGLTGNITLTFKKEGYNLVTQNINNFSNNFNVQLSYNVTINFSGISDYSNIKIKTSDREETANQNVFVLNNLLGYNEISFSKDNCTFSPNPRGVEKPENINVSIKESYSAFFNVKTDNNFKVLNASVYVGGRLATVDSAGKYTVKGLPKNQNSNVELKLEVKARSNDVVKTIYTLPLGQISKSETRDITIPNKEYCYFLFEQSLQNLREANTYQIKAEGTVLADPVLGISVGPQNVLMIYRKDANGKRIFQNLNYGKGAAGIDPRVSMLIYTDLNNKTVQYQLAKEDNVKSNLTANYTTNWITNGGENLTFTGDKAFSNFTSATGASADGFFPYNIEDLTAISSISNLVCSNNEYKFTMTLNYASENVVALYKQLMHFMVPAQNPKAFEYLYLDITISSNGFIKTMKVRERYEVTASVATTSTTGEITYNFLTNSFNETITPINIDSVQNISNSLIIEDTSAVQSSISNLFKNTLIKRREI